MRGYPRRGRACRHPETRRETVEAVFPRLGIAEEVNVKATPRGMGATGMVAAGEAEIAVMPVSEILQATGVEFAGTIPPEIQFVQVFSAAVVVGL